MNTGYFNSRPIRVRFYENEGRRNKIDLILELEESSINDFRFHNVYILFYSDIVLFILQRSSGSAILVASNKRDGK